VTDLGCLQHLEAESRGVSGAAFQITAAAAQLQQQLQQPMSGAAEILVRGLQRLTLLCGVTCAAMCGGRGGM
jgi:hypothetical protein